MKTVDEDEISLVRYDAMCSAMAEPPGNNITATTMKIHPVANLLPLLEGAEFHALVADIKANGLHEPIYLHPQDGSIVDGRNRYRACKAAGVEVRTRKWGGQGSLVDFVWSQNGNRRHLTPSQRACFALERLPWLEKEAKQRMAPGRPKKGSPKLGYDTGKSAEKAAATMHVSRGYVEHAKKLHDSEPELFQDVKAGRKTIQEALAAVKQKRKETIVQAIQDEPQALPVGPFRVIVIDPPWKYESRAEDITHRGRLQYPAMEIEEIKQLPVTELAHADCILWLWTTNAFMREAFECLDAWDSNRRRFLPG